MFLDGQDNGDGVVGKGDVVQVMASRLFYALKMNLCLNLGILAIAQGMAYAMIARYSITV